ncbi:MAG: CBS domain-containing protein [Candidatus Sumerlaeia bacterium]
MKLASLLSEDRIMVHMKAENMNEAIGRLVETFGDDLGRLKPEAVTRQLIEVEDSMPTDIGHGVRIPHARLVGLDRLLLAVGTSQEGITIREDSEDKARLIFIILTPKIQSTLMLQTMSSISRLVSNEANRKALVSTTTSQRIKGIIEETGIEVKRAIIAADLMNPPEFTIKPDMTLRDVVRVMVKCKEEGLPVINEEGELLGDLSTRMVIEVGLPKYMKMITDPNVLSEFEPFEAFYKKEDSLTAEEVMNREVLRLAPETPVEIVAHEMITKRCERAYIVEDKNLTGVVYRKDIVRKVLHL